MENREQMQLEEMLLKYKMASKVLYTGLDNLIDEYKYRTQTNPVEHMKGRIKEMDSASKKLKKKGYELTPDNLQKHIHDMVGVRIVCTFQDEVNEIVQLIQQSDNFEITEEKDYITHPKESGYQSYHMNVSIPIPYQDDIEYVDGEIQIRTVMMDAFAAIEHKLQYKNEDQDSDIANYIGNQMSQCSEYLSIIDDKMQQLDELQSNNSKGFERGKTMQKSYGKN